MAKEKAGSGSSGAAMVAAATVGTALAPIVGSDELADVLGAGVTFEDDGLSEASDEIKIAVYTLNMKGLDARGKKLPEDQFFDTIAEVTRETVEAVFLDLHRTNLFATFDEAEKKTVVHCRSFDQKTGVIQDEARTERPCAGCPHNEWKSENGKRSKDCAEVFNITAIDRGTGLPFVVRFKKTAMPEIRGYLKKHFVGRRVVNGKVGNYPLYSFVTTMTGKMEPGGKYALPILQRGPVLSREEMTTHQETQRFLRANLQAIIDRAEAQDAGAEGAPDTSFNTDKFSADKGQDFVDSPSAT